MLFDLFQSVIPGLVDTEMTERTLKEKPRLALKPMDVADVVLMAIQTPDTVLIQDLVVTPIREVTMWNKSLNTELK